LLELQFELGEVQGRKEVEEKPLLEKAQPTDVINLAEESKVTTIDDLLP
jgi:hypothetical protein